MEIHGINQDTVSIGVTDEVLVKKPAFSIRPSGDYLGTSVECAYSSGQVTLDFTSLANKGGKG